MIARATAALPFIISMPQKTEYALASYEDCGYTVVVYPPIRVDQPLPRNRPRLVVDGTPAFDANGIRIDFHKEAFERPKADHCRSRPGASRCWYPR